MGQRKPKSKGGKLIAPNGRPYADYVEALERETKKASEKVKSFAEAMGPIPTTTYRGTWTAATVTTTPITVQGINSAMNQVYTAGQPPSPPAYTATYQQTIKAELSVPLPNGDAMVVQVPVVVTRDDMRMAYEVQLSMQSLRITDQMVYGTTGGLRRRPAEDVGQPKPVRKPKEPVRPPKYRDVA